MDWSPTKQKRRALAFPSADCQLPIKTVTEKAPMGNA